MAYLEAFSPSSGRSQQSIIDAESTVPRLTGGAPPRLLPVDLAPGRALDFATEANPIGALLGSSRTPRTMRATQRTHGSPVGTIISRRRVVVRRAHRINLKLRRKRNRLLLFLPEGAPARWLNLPLMKFLAGAFEYGDKEIRKVISLGECRRRDATIRNTYNTHENMRIARRRPTN